ncbi:hypothetical protein [Caulobacter sp. NIBR2454]|uniref:hypothetical protein n=1 Tax=Caulobacter sp. NIBR2454 TaxID=3015996 RepID=UPI0022B6B863|nr:hypothetical protein [Caulobacter sp. NIBR2454]
MILLTLLTALPAPPTMIEPEPIAVAMFEGPRPNPEPSSSSASSAAATVQPKPVTRPAPQRIAKPSPIPPPPDVEPTPAGDAPTTDPGFELSEGQLIGATTAGSGSGSGLGSGSGAGGGGCNMVRLLEAALRKNAKIQAAVASASTSGKAILVWNGDWLQSPRQDGKGLAGVRQAIALEVAFAPEACRADPVKGLVVISLNDRPGGARLALGSGTWRWSDLLFARPSA